MTEVADDDDADEENERFGGCTDRPDKPKVLS